MDAVTRSASRALGRPNCQLACCSLSNNQVPHKSLVSLQGSLCGKSSMTSVRRNSSSARGLNCRSRVHSSPRTKMHFSHGPADEEFVGDDDDFVEASVLQAVEVRYAREGFVFRMADGRIIMCAHNKPENAASVSYSHPAIVLRIEDGSNLFLPIIVSDHPSMLLMEAMSLAPTARPTIYQVLTQLVDALGYQILLVRITHRLSEAYFARVFLSKADNLSDDIMSLDMRPSDAINLAVRAKVPIQVSRALAACDGVRIIEEQSGEGKRRPRQKKRREDFVVEAVDMSVEDGCQASQEFKLLQLLQQATQEERYHDAAELRDKLNSLRSGDSGSGSSSSREKLQ
eukprot:TRINITY_DN3310_c0_g1_i1.p1 TRINITY_DN3310_c0_g1~~TRINITY_DN3310_c0_g1_i1.p1  ORF type:complete len:343 (+),score=41.66 TRINITY_DN3310_c0_g1_i1:96-1124(+)